MYMRITMAVALLVLLGAVALPAKAEKPMLSSPEFHLSLNAPNESVLYGATHPWCPIKNPPASTHEFQPVRSTGDRAPVLNIKIDGKTWKYLAYDSDQNGNEIRLYMSNDFRTWVYYDENPILSGKNRFRWPSTIYYNGTFYMFVDERANHDIVLYTAKDGIHYTEREVILKSTITNNPFIWFSPKDHHFYLYNHPTKGTVAVKRSCSITGLAKAANHVVIRGAAAPAIMYYQHRYYLFVEQGGYKENWYVEVYISSNPEGGFKDYMTIIPPSMNEACPIPAMADGTYLFTNHYYGDKQNLTRWSPVERALTFTISPSEPDDALLISPNALKNKSLWDEIEIKKSAAHVRSGTLSRSTVIDTIKITKLTDTREYAVRKRENMENPGMEPAVQTHECKERIKNENVNASTLRIYHIYLPPKKQPFPEFYGENTGLKNCKTTL